MGEIEILKDDIKRLKEIIRQDRILLNKLLRERHNEDRHSPR